MDQTSPWGIVLHASSEWDIAELHKGGVAWLRIDIPWATVQPNAGQPFTWLHFDRLVRWATDRGMWILFGLGGTPAWAVDPARMAADGNRYRPDAYPARNLALWEEYVRQVLTRYGAKVRYWGIWNEPNSFNEPANVCFWRGTQQEFLDGVLIKAFNVIRGFGPAHRICVPDLAGNGGVLWPAGRPHWIRDVLAKLGGRNVHAVSVHIYHGSGDGSDVADRAETAKTVVAAYNSANGTNVELWITETGWQTQQHSEAAISQKIVDLCNVVRQKTWLKKIFPYVWSDGEGEIFSFKSGLRTTRQQWNGYKTGIRAPQPAVPLERDALVVSHNLPTQMVRNQGYDIRMTLRNTGRWAWPKQGVIRLGFGSQPTQIGQAGIDLVDTSNSILQYILQKNNGLLSMTRVQVVDRAPVATGGETTFTFRLTAPAQAGFYQAVWGMLDERPGDAMWFGQGVFLWAYVT